MIRRGVIECAMYIGLLLGVAYYSGSCVGKAIGWVFEIFCNCIVSVPIIIVVPMKNVYLIKIFYFTTEVFDF